MEKQIQLYLGDCLQIMPKISEKSIGEISFAVSLFPNMRYFTKGEQEAFEGYKRKHFKRFKLNF